MRQEKAKSPKALASLDLKLTQMVYMWQQREKSIFSKTSLYQSGLLSAKVRLMMGNIMMGALSDWKKKTNMVYYRELPSEPNLEQ